ncbi:TK protein kinase [Salpingoeca rosetta]|uniref:non-specific protein-tyrosine kinase n=1 Tax=Salpingoeca rosetta (strain ATCC 50818 / BSB-021) TaxID=946362 RepID=F2UDX1_SALR5|nr:TK protein kinase [Salpingoeca rosetta]EGD74821.1 TK protein kinase [Salpingoeca rosetta]|eukprot:XP_004992466.1 TK protein kinase [Salpingoeca rosetta]
MDKVDDTVTLSGSGSGGGGGDGDPPPAQDTTNTTHASNADKDNGQAMDSPLTPADTPLPPLPPTPAKNSTTDDATASASDDTSAQDSEDQSDRAHEDKQPADEEAEEEEAEAEEEEEAEAEEEAEEDCEPLTMPAPEEDNAQQASTEQPRVLEEELEYDDGPKEAFNDAAAATENGDTCTQESDDACNSADADCKQGAQPQADDADESASETEAEVTQFSPKESGSAVVMQVSTGDAGNEQTADVECSVDDNTASTADDTTPATPTTPAVTEGGNEDMDAVALQSERTFVSCLSYPGATELIRDQMEEDISLLFQLERYITARVEMDRAHAMQVKEQAEETKSFLDALKYQNGPVFQGFRKVLLGHILASQHVVEQTKAAKLEVIKSVQDVKAAKQTVRDVFDSINNPINSEYSRHVDTITELKAQLRAQCKAFSDKHKKLKGVSPGKKNYNKLREQLKEATIAMHTTFCKLYVSAMDAKEHVDTYFQEELPTLLEGIEEQNRFLVGDVKRCLREMHERFDYADKEMQGISAQNLRFISAIDPSREYQQLMASFDAPNDNPECKLDDETNLKDTEDLLITTNSGITDPKRLLFADTTKDCLEQICTEERKFAEDRSQHLATKETQLHEMEDSAVWLDNAPPATDRDAFNLRRSLLTNVQNIHCKRVEVASLRSKQRRHKTVADLVGGFLDEQGTAEPAAWSDLIGVEAPADSPTKKRSQSLLQKLNPFSRGSSRTSVASAESDHRGSTSSSSHHETTTTAPLKEEPAAENEVGDASGSDGHSGQDKAAAAQASTTTATAAEDNSHVQHSTAATTTGETTQHGGTEDAAGDDDGDGGHMNMQDEYGDTEVEGGDVSHGDAAATATTEQLRDKNKPAPATGEEHTSGKSGDADADVADDVYTDGQAANDVQHDHAVEGAAPVGETAPQQAPAGSSNSGNDEQDETAGYELQSEFESVLDKVDEEQHGKPLADRPLPPVPPPADAPKPSAQSFYLKPQERTESDGPEDGPAPPVPPRGSKPARPTESAVNMPLPNTPRPPAPSPPAPPPSVYTRRYLVSRPREPFDPLSSTIPFPIDVAVALEDQPWFFGDIARQGAEQLLEQPGDFLVRFSTNKNRNIVTVADQFMQARHYVIEEGEGLCWIQQLSFPSTPALVAHHVHTRAPITPTGAQAKFPVFRMEMGEVKVWYNSELQQIRDLGSGHFGAVKLMKDTRTSEQYAVKTCTNDTILDTKEFMREAITFSHLAHKNIARMFGVTNDTPLRIVMELCENGALLNYLRDKGPHEPRQQLWWCQQVCEGMIYLSEQNCIHRDLAARNTLLANDLTAKISDFGLSRLVSGDEGLYQVRFTKAMPIRWTAPEALFYSTFSLKSDVWSFGVLMYEVFSGGKIPYAGYATNEEVKQFVDRGGHLENPGTTDAMFQIMQRCWVTEVQDRISFRELSGLLTAIESDFIGSTDS